MLATTLSDPGSHPVLNVGMFVGLFVGFFLGWAHALWRQARTTYARTKGQLPAMRQTMRTSLWRLVTHGAAAVALAVLGVIALTSAGKG